MFGPSGIGRFKQMREQAKTATRRTVTRAEFIEAMMKTGASQKEAEMQAKVGSALGGEALVGDELLTIKEDRDDEQAPT